MNDRITVEQLAVARDGSGFAAAAGSQVEAAQAVRTARAGVRTRQILRAAAQLMSRTGSSAVSMQAIADEAGVSVGLLYRYFSNKQDLVHAIIVEVLEDAQRRVPRAILQASEDPVRRLVAGFRSYCHVIAEHRHAAVLTYRESKALSGSRQEHLKVLEAATTRPLADAIREVVRADIGTTVDPDLLAYDLVLFAHAWALKHWYFEPTHSLDKYIEAQTSLVLYGLIPADRRTTYADLLI